MGYVCGIPSLGKQFFGDHSSMHCSLVVCQSKAFLWILVIVGFLSFVPTLWMIAPISIKSHFYTRSMMTRASSHPKCWERNDGDVRIRGTIGQNGSAWRRKSSGETGTSSSILFSPETRRSMLYTDMDISSCPQTWQLRYTRVHQLISNTSVQPLTSQRILLYNAHSAEVGLYDRLRTVITAFYFAILTGRALKVRHLLCQSDCDSFQS